MAMLQRFALPFSFGARSDQTLPGNGWRGVLDTLSRSRIFQAVLAVFAIGAVALIAAIALRPAAPVAKAPEQVAREAKAALAAAPKIEFDPNVVPTVEPLTFLSIGADAARILNASVPFSSEPNPAAAPFVATMLPDDFARAVDCLAAAVLYEAGANDAEGQQAVAQVILNRVRHPAFPHTVCGVVFQGSERTTGCQFTFTCDGSLARPQSADGWARARVTARQALSGYVYAPVGLATHYHTDWVVPYWSASLEKITEVHTHLFFRWPKGWGTPKAFTAVPTGIEPTIAKLAAISDVHKPADQLASLRLTEALGRMQVTSENGTILVGVDESLPPEQLPELAKLLCGKLDECRVLGWRSATPNAMALVLSPDQIGKASYSFYRTSAAAEGKSAWNCAQYDRKKVNSCLDRAQLASISDHLAPSPAMALDLPPLPIRDTVAVAAPSEPTGELAAVGPIAGAAPAPQPIAVSATERARDADEAVRKQRRDRCSAMRLVSQASRVGPCANRLD